ncbi:MAG: hypothetical protein EZS28_033361, partial [Streblomastix strix]
MRTFFSDVLPFRSITYPIVKHGHPQCPQKVQSYPDPIKSVSGFNAPILILDASPIDTAILRLAALMNKFFPYYVSFPVEQLELVKSCFNSHPAYISRYIVPPSPESVGTVQLVKVVLSVPVINILPDVLLNVPFITPPFPFAM